MEDIKGQSPRSLYTSYQNVRATPLTFADFLMILNLYPSILVCMSDGVLDEEEWKGFLTTARGLVMRSDSSLEDTQLRDLFLKEFRYLLEHTEEWQDRFLEALRIYLIDSEGDKEFVLESMYLFANASKGISDVEMKKIDNLSEELSLVS